MARTLWALVAVLLLVAATVGCSPSGTDTAGSQEPEDVVSTPENAAGEAPETAPEDSDASGPATLTPETDGEKNALVTAETEEARLWGSGDTVNGTPVEGDPFLVGYGVLLHDGATQYQVVVIDGAVQRFFGNTQGLRYIEAPFSDFSPTITPESDRQREAFEAAKTEIASVNPKATQGGIEFYYVFYPSTLESTFPSVALYTSPSLSASLFASGGSYGWQ